MLRRLFLKNDDSSRPLSWWSRLLLAGLGLALAVPLTVACMLKPDPTGKGYGTHEQLGLPPCTFTTVVGIRCPSCGMTTSWAFFMRGRVDRAMMANTGGTLLVLIAVVTTPWALATGARGRFLWGRPTDIAIALGTAVVLVVTLLDWAVRLAVG
ncbi:MAG: DUF2752 domain-containing protein [Pirellulales bacterium]|nr:DUF2752 domain-containing protein [Pirellulales bacterium]